MTLVRRRPRFPPLRSATPPCEAQNADHPLLPVVSFSMSPPVPFRMSFDSGTPTCLSCGSSACDRRPECRSRMR